MATVEERLLLLEKKDLPTVNMRNRLYEDYARLGPMLAEAGELLVAARRTEREAYQKLKDMRERYDRESAALLALDERAGGKNDTERKRNGDALIYSERAGSGKLGDSWSALMSAEREYESAVTEKEICIDQFSAARYLLRTVGNMAYSLGA
jgi:hypothetical protein